MYTVGTHVRIIHPWNYNGVKAGDIGVVTQQRFSGNYYVRVRAYDGDFDLSQIPLFFTPEFIERV